MEWAISAASRGKVRRAFRLGSATADVYVDSFYAEGALLAADYRTGPGTRETRHFTLDHLGSPRVVTNASAVRIGEHEYYSYGEEATTAGGTLESLRFTGHERDFLANGGGQPAADALDYLHKRYSSPLTGRFLSADPVLTGRALKRPQAWNRYSYAICNPLKHIDPDGREAMIFIVAPSRVDTDPRGGLGHSAIYVTSSRGNDGVSYLGRFNFKRGMGAFIQGYVDQGREVKMFVLKTTAEQDAKMVEFIRKNPEGGIDRNGYVMTENCSGAVVNVLQAGGVVEPNENPARYFLIANTPSSLEDSLESRELSSQVGAVVTFQTANDSEREEEPSPRVQGRTLVGHSGQICTGTGACW